MAQLAAVATHSDLLRLPEPVNVDQVGVRRAFLEDLALKTIYVTAPPSLIELAATMKLGYRVVDELFQRLRAEQLCEVTGMRGNAREIALTSRGRTHALELLALSHYVGAAPVSIENYVRVVRQQSVRDLVVHLPDVRRAFSSLVLEEDTLNKIGTALNSGSSIFLYGPTGTGKTAIATTLPRVMANDRVWIPHAVQTDGQVITVYDPHVHATIPDQIPDDHDARWVLCHRPAVMAGGELTIEMLELQLNPSSRYYTAPIQMKANNGVLVIDDFGRQRVRPEDLLNRWIVPLDRRIDFLTLAGGRKIEIPFELFVVFATNLNPSTLGDAAFLRRIQTKIRVGEVAYPRFHEIFARVCEEFGMRCEGEVVDDLIDLIRNKYHEPLRACHPRDIVSQIRWAARFDNREPRLDRASLQRAVEAYFVSDEDDEKEGQNG
jgi:energy-coupling factor transporter ATP-binding protein EcfA2